MRLSEKKLIEMLKEGKLIHYNSVTANPTINGVSVRSIVEKWRREGKLLIIKRQEGKYSRKYYTLKEFVGLHETDSTKIE